MKPVAPDGWATAREFEAELLAARAEAKRLRKTVASAAISVSACGDRDCDNGGSLFRKLWEIADSLRSELAEDEAV